MRSRVRAGRKDLRGRTGRKDGIRSQGRARKARAARAGKAARNRADYLFYKQSTAHSYSLCFCRQAVMAMGKFVLQLYSK